jgi:hypothetical protein
VVRVRPPVNLGSHAPLICGDGGKAHYPRGVRDALGAREGGGADSVFKPIPTCEINPTFSLLISTLIINLNSQLNTELSTHFIINQYIE